MHDSNVTARRAALGGAGAVLLLALAVLVAAGWAASRPLHITVDGRAVEVSSGTTCADLVEKDAVAAHPGDLIGVDGSLVMRNGGEPPKMSRNGAEALPWQRLYDGDEVHSARGENRVESLVVADEAVPFETRYEGRGSIVQIASLGAPGITRVTRGSFSGIEVTRTVVQEPEDAVFVRSGPTKGAKLVALTFDDGPQKGQTDKILDVLARYNVKATFFVLGDRTGRNPALVRRAAREGHQIANHSLSHKDFTSVDNKEIRRQIAGGQQHIKHATGAKASTRWIRPPYGATNSRVWKVLKSQKQRVVMWDVDPQDWRRPGSPKIAARVISNVKPGSVVLLHDGGPDRRQTIAALPRIIRELRKKGYQFVTVEELVAAQ